MKVETNYRIKLPNECIVECTIPYKLIPNAIHRIIFRGDLIQFDLSNFGIILGMNSLRNYGTKIDYEDPEVILRDEKEVAYVFMGKKGKNHVP